MMMMMMMMMVVVVVVVLVMCDYWVIQNILIPRLTICTSSRFVVNGNTLLFILHINPD